MILMKLTQGVQLTFAYWQTTDTRDRVENYLRDEQGNSIWSGDAQFLGQSFSVRSSDFRVEERDRKDILLGLTVEGTTDTEWNESKSLHLLQCT